MTTTAAGTAAPLDPRSAGAVDHRTLRIGHGALLRAIEKNTVGVVLPGLGSVQLPPPDVLAWFGGLGALVALGIMEWPIAVAIGTGHLLAQQHHLRLLRDFGEALEAA